VKKSNIIFLFTDQFRYDAIAALGNPIIKTPVLDALVNEGVSFANAFTACPVCVPARYALHSGQMPHRTGVFENYQIPAGRRSFMECLTDGGYQTHGVGKMHFTFETGPETMWGFEGRTMSEGGKDNAFSQNAKDHGYGHVTDSSGVRSEMYYIPQVSPLPAELHHTSWSVDASLDFLKGRDQDRPFFLMTSFTKPHPPFAPPQPWNKLYRGPEMPLPKVPQDSEALMTLWNRFQNRYKYRDQGTDLNLIRQMIAYYYAEISFIDYNLGRLFEYLKQEGLFDDTLIVFSSDHGEFLGDYGCFGKRSFLDASARVPLIVKYPGCEPHSECKRPVSLVDLMPTFLEFAGITPEEDLSGESLFAMVDGRSDRDTIFGHYEQKEYASYMSLTEDYKYIYSAPDETEYLFDRVRDPDETRNKAMNPLFVEKTKEMRGRIIDYFKDEGYTETLDGDTWKKYGKKSMPEDPDAYLLFQDPADSIPHIPGYETDVNSKKHFRFQWFDNRYDTV
jgi:arylsulfatase